MKKLILSITILLVLIYTECSATELGEADKLALKAEVEVVAEEARLALQNQDYEKFISLIIPAQPAHNFTKETFAECLAGERCKKSLLESFTLADSTIQFLDLRQEGDYILYYRHGREEFSEQGKDFKYLRIALSAFKKTETGIKIFGKSCGLSHGVSKFEDINNKIAEAMASSACLSNPIAYWENEAKQEKVQK